MPACGLDVLVVAATIRSRSRSPSCIGIASSSSAEVVQPAESLACPFVPAAGSGHAMTVFTWARQREFPNVPAPEERLIRTAPDVQVRARCYWQNDRAAAPTLVALHGLEGSADAHYMRGLAAKAWALGWNAVLLNQRNCGGTEQLAPSLYHSGLTGDPLSVMRTLSADESLTRIGVVGYSLGGNLTIKLAGELAEHPDVPVFAVVAVSPTIDLERCVRAIERKRISRISSTSCGISRAECVGWRRTGRAAQPRSAGRIWMIRTFDEV